MRGRERVYDALGKDKTSARRISLSLFLSGARHATQTKKIIYVYVYILVMITFLSFRGTF